MKIVRVGALVLFALVSHFCYSQVLDDAREAFQKAESTGKPVLLVFSGSDWCAPCIRFYKKVLSQDHFLDYAADHFVVLNADFPQRKKLAESLVKQNEKLAERFNPKGQFPHVVLLSPGQQLLRTIQYKNQSAEQFIADLGLQFAE